MNTVQLQTSHESIRKYTIPKAINDKANLVLTSLNSRDVQDLLSELPKYQKQANFDFRLDEVNSVEFVRNSVLFKRFGERRTSMRKENVVREKYAFTVIRKREMIEEIAMSGLKCASVDCSDFTYVLGDFEKGVHLFKKPDVALMHYGSSKGLLEFGLVVFKILLCKGNRVVPQKINGNELLEPQPDFDYHFSTNDPFIDSLVYLYDYDENEDPREIPLSILPFAVVNYKLNEPFLEPVSQNKKRIVRTPRINPKFQPPVSETLANPNSEAKATKEDEIKIDLSLIGPTPPQPIFTPSLKKKRITAACSMRLSLYDIILSGWNLKLPISHYENRNVLLKIAPLSSRALAYLRRAGRTYSSHPAPRLDVFDLVDIVRQLPPDSNLTASFHLVIGFLKFYINTTPVAKVNAGIQTELSSIDKYAEYLEKMAKTFTECVLGSQKLTSKAQKNAVEINRLNSHVNESKQTKEDNGICTKDKAASKLEEKTCSAFIHCTDKEQKKPMTKSLETGSGEGRNLSKPDACINLHDDSFKINNVKNICASSPKQSEVTVEEEISFHRIAPVGSTNPKTNSINAHCHKVSNLVDICIEKKMKNELPTPETITTGGGGRAVVMQRQNNVQTQNIRMTSESELKRDNEMNERKKGEEEELSSTLQSGNKRKFESSTKFSNDSSKNTNNSKGEEMKFNSSWKNENSIEQDAIEKKRQRFSPNRNKESCQQRNGTRHSNFTGAAGGQKLTTSSTRENTAPRTERTTIMSESSITKKLKELSESGTLEMYNDEKKDCEKNRGSEIIVSECSHHHKSSETSLESNTKSQVDYKIKSGNQMNEKRRLSSEKHCTNEVRGMGHETWNTKLKSNRKKSATPPERRMEEGRRVDMRKTTQTLERDNMRLLDCRSKDDGILVWRREIEKIKDQLRLKNQRIKEEPPESRRSKRDIKYDSDDSDDDEHFILRLILHSITEGSGHRLSNRLRRRLKSAFFFHLRRVGEIDLFERDRLLVELGTCAQRGHWKFCLDKLEVPRELFSNHSIEKLSDGEGGGDNNGAAGSAGAGDMWRDTLLKKADAAVDYSRSSRALSPNESREVSRYADDVFSDTLNRSEVHVTRKRRVSSPPPSKRSMYPSTALSIPPPSFFSIPPPQFLFSSSAYGFPLALPRIPSDYRSRMLSFYHSALQR